MPRPLAKPITIRGVSYPSIGAAARALGVTKQSIQLTIKRGDLNNIGLGPKNRAGWNHVASKPITIRGVEYPSRTIAGEVLGVAQSNISRAEKEGRLDFVGLGRSYRD